MKLLSSQNSFRIASLSIAVIGMLFVVIGVWFSLMIGVLGLALAYSNRRHRMPVAPRFTCR